jgi:mannose-1-phosphate guanylyltransferase
MLLAAGRGERMQPLTATRAKPTLPLLGRPILARILARLASGGIETVAVNGFHAAESIEAVANEEAPGSMRVEMHLESTLMGTGGAFDAPRETLGDGEIFLVHNGDTLVPIPFDALSEAALGENRVGALLVRPRALAGYKPIAVRDGEVVGFEADGVNGDPATYLGVAVFRREVLDRVPRGRPSAIFGDVVMPMLAEGGRLAAVETENHWLEFTSPASYRRRLETLVSASRNEGLVELPGGAARIVRGPSGALHVGEGVTLGAAFRGHGGCVVESGARLGTGASLHGSVVLERARLGDGVTLRRAIVAPDVVVPSWTEWCDGVVVPGGPDLAAQLVPFAGGERDRP